MVKIKKTKGIIQEAQYISESRRVLRGQSISSGFGNGRAFVYRDILSHDLISYDIHPDKVEEELCRIKAAMQHVLKDLRRMKRMVKEDIGRHHAAIFEAHKEILKDDVLVKDLEKRLRDDLVNAEQVVKNVFRKWSSRFRASEDAGVQGKADDMDDLSRRILRFLMGYEKNVLEKLPPGSIVIARRLLPSDTVHLKRKNVNGIIVEEGSKSSHSAIIAGALGVPAVANLEQSLDVIKKGDRVIVDGERGILIVHPSSREEHLYREKIKDAKKGEKAVVQKAQRLAKTKDGRIVPVYANASSPGDFAEALAKGCDGIGLFRIEHIYLARKVLPGEEELEKIFSRVLRNAPKKEITVRLLDIGGDKKLPYLEIEEELNPFLGLRGVRLLLRHENLLKTQLRVLIRLSRKYKIKILIPMITLPCEAKMVKKVAAECREKLMEESGVKFKKVQIGSMIETPAAVINIREIAKMSDFLSIGTNDLIQYTMAAGRENTSVAGYYEAGTKAIIGFVKKVADVARNMDIECSLCGEIAGDAQWTEALLKAGVSALSVSPHRIPVIKDRIRNLTV